MTSCDIAGQLQSWTINGEGIITLWRASNALDVLECLCILAPSTFDNTVHMNINMDDIWNAWHEIQYLNPCT